MIKMKKLIILAAVAVLGITGAIAQQVPLYSHFYYNQFLYNPSLAGTKPFGQLFLVNRNQWNSIPGAPRTQALTVDGPLKNNKVGIGLGVYHDQAGIFNITGAQAAYRYSLDFGKNRMLSFGLGLGVLNNRLDLNDVKVKDVLDPDIYNAYQSATGFDANIGLNYKWNNLVVGFTVPQIIGGELAYEAIQNKITNGTVQYGMIRHFLVHANYEWDVFGNEKWFYQPNVIVRVTPNAPTSFDINGVVSYKHLYWGGIMYRRQYAITASAGLRIGEQIVAGYAYDFAIHDVSQYTRGAHEVMVGWQWGGSPSDDPKIKAQLKAINDKINSTDQKVDSIGKEVKKTQKDLDETKDDVKDQEDEIDELRQKIKTFEDFMKDVKDGKIGSGSKSGDVFTFNNVYFETNKWDLNGVSTEELDNLATVLKENPNLKIEIAGHADKRGSVSYNIWLSNKRANAVRDYLIKKGVSASQLEVKGYGASEPASTKLDENRRVEFKILSK
ncbi:MAG: type IX secretion system membrane protein PorP/SprF [Bacteroidetes bacterium]|nr:type IX secretion system membrane protein PorP/SprF [Bacteroidota bacterium]